MTKPSPRGSPMASRRGVILVAAIVLCVIMVLVATMIGNQKRAVLGYMLDTQSETLQTECAGYAFSQLRGVLQHDSVPLSPAGAPSALGLPTPLTRTASMAGNSSSNDAVFTGQLSYLKLSGPGGPDGYADPTTIAGTGMGTGISSKSIPTAHSAAVLTASLAADSIKQRYLTVFTGNYPFGLLATGKMTVKSAHSSTSYDGQATSGVMANLFALGDVSLGELYGRAYTKSANLVLTDLAKGGITYTNWPNTDIWPADFLKGLSDWKGALASAVANPPLSQSLTSKFDDLHDALHDGHHLLYDGAVASFTAQASWGVGSLSPKSFADPASGAPTLVPPTVASLANATLDSHGTDYTGDKSHRGTLKITTSLHIPSGEEQDLSGFDNVVIDNDLVIEDNSFLRISQNLTVTCIYLGKNSTLVVDGATQAQRLCVSYSLSGNSNIGLCSTFYGKGPVIITDGMQRATVSFPGLAPFVTKVGSAPYPTSLTAEFMYPTPPDLPPHSEARSGDNSPLQKAWTAAQDADVSKVIGSDTINSYLGGTTAVGADTTDVPGVFTLSDSDLTFNSGAKVSGLLYNTGSVNLGTVQKAVGSIWTGNLNAQNTDYLSFPYYTHAFVRTPGHANVTVSAVEQHPAAYGKVP